MDLAMIFDDWPFDEMEESNNIRKIMGIDGRVKLQLRLRDGVIQWNLDGRPDGARPYEAQSVLDHCRHLAADHPARPGDPPFQLDQRLVDELEVELVDYSRRLTALLKIRDYDHAQRDAAHGLGVLSILRRHGSDHAVAREYDRYRPQLISDRAKAEALLAGQGEMWLDAVHALNRGIGEIEDYFAEHQQQKDLVKNPQREHLVELRRSLRERHNIPLTDPELLKSLEAEQELAVQKEDFEMAARLRDKIKLVMERLGRPA